MLQFIYRRTEKYSPTELASLVVGGGCRWIEINMPQASDNDVRNTAMDMIDTCRDNDTFLIVRDHIDVVDELKVSGLHLSDPSQAKDARERLGANAIIGVTVTDPEQVIALKRADIDYATVDENDPEKLAAFVKAVRDAGVEMAIVAAGNIGIRNMEAVLASGVSGVAMSDAIIDSDDPMLYTGQVMEKILHINPAKQDRVD